MSRTFTELFDQYELHARARGFSSSQISLTRLAVGFFIRFLETINDPQDVTADDFRRFVVDLRSRRVLWGSGKNKESLLSGTTVNTYARVVKAFFSWLNEEGIIIENPLALIPAPRKPKTIPKVYRENELLAVSKAITNARDLAIYSLILDSGIRLNELSTLNIGNIDIEKGNVSVMGKGGKERFVYYSPPVVESIKAYVKEFRLDASKNDALFVTSKGSRLTKRGIQIMLYRLGEKAGLKERLSPHKLRHTFATLSLKYGGNLEYIRKILGHSDIKTTSEAYLNVLDEDVSAAHQQFSPVSNLQSGGTMKESALPDEERSRSQPALSGTAAGQYPYKETSHEPKMRELAGDLIYGLRLPLTKDSFIAELRPGRIVIGKERLAVTVNERGKIHFGFSTALKGDVGLFHQSLRTHLETADLANVLPDILSWSEGVASNLKNCHELLKRVRTIVEDSYRTHIPIGDEGNPGFSMDFPMLICADAVEQANGSTHFKDFQYRYDDLELKFGGYKIYFGTPNEDLKPFEDAHINLREECATWQQTEAIAKERRKLDGIALAVGRQLNKFIAFKRLPGYCELCS